MKKYIWIIALLIVALSNNVVTAQNMDCLGLKNPLNFTFSGGTGSSSWTGLVGSKNETASTCTTIGSTLGTTVQAAQLESQSSNSNCTTVSSVDIHNTSDMYKRFVIKGRGTDAATGNHLTYTPSVNGVLDTSYHSSIRLGNFCGGGEAEALLYQFSVNANNALVTLWYALSLQNGQHTAAANPEFVVHIEKLVGTNWVRIGGDTLCYVQPTPTSSSTDITSSGFYVGTTGTHLGATYACNVYLPWNKVVINLNKYLYQTVRIKIAAGDCAYSAHYACAYIAGDCQPMLLTANGCAAGATEQVAEIRAPKGLLSYQWYRSRSGVLSGVPRTSDTSYVAIQGATDSILQVQIPHFISTHGTFDTLPQNTFKCVMTSLMNKNQPNYTISSALYSDVGNMKPTLSVDTTLYCDGTVELKDVSIARFTNSLDINNVDTTVTKWKFYNTATPAGTPVDSAIGGTAYHRFQTAGTHCVTVRTASGQTDATGARTCWNEKTVSIRSIRKPVPTIQLSRDSLCTGDTIVLYDRTTGSIYHRWHLTNAGGLDTVFVSPTPAVQFPFTETTTVELTTHDRSTFLQDTNNDGTLENVYCDTVAYATVHVEKYPSLEVSGDTIVCMGTLAVVNVSSDVANCTYQWSHTLGGTPFQTSNTMQEMPQVDTRYYVKVTSPFGCVSWDSLAIKMVDPVLVSPLTDICEGQFTKLYASNAASFTWSASPDDESLLGQENNDTINVSPATTTTYTLIGHGTNGCNANALTRQITVYPYPIMAFEMSPGFIDSEKPTVTFRDVSANATSSLWNFGNGNTSTERQVKYTFTGLTEDSILISLSSGNALGCKSDTSFYVPVSLFSAWFPTAFTPTVATNRTFKVFTHNTLEYYSLYIYNRGGDLVFYSNDQNAEWDGKYKGKFCDQGIYVYVCTYRRPGTTDIVTRKGTVMLLQ